MWHKAAQISCIKIFLNTKELFLKRTIFYAHFEKTNTAKSSTNIVQTNRFLKQQQKQTLQQNGWSEKKTYFNSIMTYL